MQASLDGGDFVTKPIVSKGSELVMNFSTSAAGSVCVEIQDIGSSPIPGFGLVDSAEIFGDEIERTVTWNHGSDVSRLAGRPIRLHVMLRDANLYSFRFA